MKPTKFKHLAEEYGSKETYKAGQVFHGQDFPNKLFMLKRGYVKRYQATKPDSKVIELIYGPDHIISLSQLYKHLFGISQNQENLIYIYQAMTDAEVLGVDAKIVLKELEKDPELYKDFFYESGLKLRSNISRLASNALSDDYKKVAHQLVSLAYEFAGISEGSVAKFVELPLPESAADIAEQLNISRDVAGAVMTSLEKKHLIKVDDQKIKILDIALLKDVYLDG